MTNIVDVIEADFHIHSKYSKDSLLSPKSVIRVAKKKGLSAIAITDHETIKGAKEAMKENESSDDFFVIPGIEIKTEIGDIIGLFVEETFLFKDIYEAIDKIKKMDGLLVLPHPLRGHKEIPKKVILETDLIEALNGRSPSLKNREAKELAIYCNKPLIAGSDAHFLFEIGCVRTVLSGFAGDLEDLRKLIKHGERILIGRESPFFVHILSWGIELFKQFFV
ncbi:MAG: PHP domain-containing protein [Candidatus Bathyarchaeia archaeon]